MLLRNYYSSKMTLPPAYVDFKTNKFNLYIVAIAIGAGLIPLVAPQWMQQMPHSLHPLLESGILLTSLTAVVLNFFFNGGSGDQAGPLKQPSQPKRIETKTDAARKGGVVRHKRAF